MMRDQKLRFAELNLSGNYFLYTEVFTRQLLQVKLRGASVENTRLH